jgi:hypothetical protein
VGGCINDFGQFCRFPRWVRWVGLSVVRVIGDGFRREKIRMSDRDALHEYVIIMNIELCV